MAIETTLKERLKQFISYLNISERQFCANIGVGFAYVSSIKRSISAEKLEAISRRYPELNPIWLMRGDGEMLIPGVTPTLFPAKPQPPKEEGLSASALLKLLEAEKEEKGRLLSIIESQQRTIETLAELSNKKVARTVEPATCADAG